MGIHGEEELNKLCSVENYNIYHTGPKRRLVEAPNKRLKLIQKRFNNYLQKIETPKFVFAGRKKTNNILNAKVHIDCNDMICTDIKKFFPNTNIKYVKQFLIKYLKMTEGIADILSKILTVNNHLPTGAPSSVLLTYWSYKDAFDTIHDYAENIGIKMTIYVDDMTFSSKSKISRTLIPFVDKNELELLQNGDELTVSIKNEKRIFSLPQKLQSKEIIKAKYENESLNIYFK